MSEDTVAGAIKETGGKVRSKIGEWTGDTEGEVRGKMDQVSGNIQKNIGKIKDSVED